MRRVFASHRRTLPINPIHCRIKSKRVEIVEGDASDDDYEVLHPHTWQIRELAEKMGLIVTNWVSTVPVKRKQMVRNLAAFLLEKFWTVGADGLRLGRANRSTMLSAADMVQ